MSYTTRRRLLAATGAAAGAAALGACSLWPKAQQPLEDLLRPRSIEVPQDRLSAQLAALFPVTRRMLEIFDVTVAAPRVGLAPERNRITTEFDVSTAPTLLQDGYKGKLTLSHALRYEGSDASVRLTHVRLEQFQMDNVPDAQKSRTGRIGAVLAEQLLNDQVVYRFSTEDMKSVLGKGYRPGNLAVTARGLALMLEPLGVP